MSPRPGRIIDIVDCTALGRERPLEIRETPEFLRLGQRVREGLRAGHASGIEWVTNRTVLAVLRHSARSCALRWSRTISSSAPKGSSIKSSFGFYLSTRVVVMSPRPGRIIDIVDCTALGRERPLETCATARGAAR
jgi:hypothetical protein